MLNRIKKFASEHSIEIALSVGLIGVAIITTRTSFMKTTLSGGAVLEIPGGAVESLLNGKTVLIDCLEDASLLIQYVPKT